MTRRGLLSVALAGLCVVSLLAAAPLFDQADSPAARTLLGIEWTPTPAGRVAAARPWLLRAALALATGALVAPALGSGLERAAADAATHATLGGALAVTVAGALATRLLGTAGTPTLRPPAGWLAATAGAGAVLAGAFALPAAVGVATRTAVVTVPGLLTVVGTLTEAAGATTVRAVVTPLVVLLALAPALALLVGLATAERVALLRRERGPAALAAGLLAAGALVSAVLTRDPARTIAATALALLAWDAAEFGGSLAALVGEDGAPRLERAHATASLAVATLAGTMALGLASAFGPVPSDGGAAVVLLVGAAAAGLLALHGG